MKKMDEKTKDNIRGGCSNCVYKDRRIDDNPCYKCSQATHPEFVPKCELCKYSSRNALTSECTICLLQKGKPYYEPKQEGEEMPREKENSKIKTIRVVFKQAFDSENSYVDVECENWTLCSSFKERASEILEITANNEVVFRASWDDILYIKEVMR